MGFDPFLNREWVAALRSGEYKQGQDYLRCDGAEDYDEPTFCCLGVLADIVDPHAWTSDSGRVMRWHNKRINLLNSSFEFDVHPDLIRAQSLLQDSVAFHGGTYNVNYDIEGLLMGMNDRDWTFDEIADALEVLIP